MQVNIEAAAESVREAIPPEFVAMIEAQLKGMVPDNLIAAGRNQALGEILATSMANAFDAAKPSDDLQRTILMHFVASSGCIGLRNQFLVKFDATGNRRA